MTDGDIRILSEFSKYIFQHEFSVEFEDEFARKKSFNLVYPNAKNALRYLRRMRSPLYSNLLLTHWMQLPEDERLEKRKLLMKLTAIGKNLSVNYFEFLKACILRNHVKKFWEMQKKQQLMKHEFD